MGAGRGGRLATLPPPRRPSKVLKEVEVKVDAKTNPHLPVVFRFHDLCADLRNITFARHNPIRTAPLEGSSFEGDGDGPLAAAAAALQAARCGSWARATGALDQLYTSFANAAEK